MYRVLRDKNRGGKMSGITSEHLPSEATGRLRPQSSIILMISVVVILLLWLADHAFHKNRITVGNLALSKATETNSELIRRVTDLQKRAASGSPEENLQLEQLRTAQAEIGFDVVAVTFRETVPAPSSMLIKDLTRFHHLQTLTIRSPGLSNLSLQPVCKLPSLRYVFLGGDCLADADAEVLQILRELPNLESLELADASFGEEVYHQISQNKSLRLVSLNRSAVNDHHVEIMAKCAQLEILYLSDTLITDDCIPFLTRMTNLRELLLPATISSTAEERLTNALNGCSVYVRR